MAIYPQTPNNIWNMAGDAARAWPGVTSVGGTSTARSGATAASGVPNLAGLLPRTIGTAVDYASFLNPQGYGGAQPARATSTDILRSGGVNPMVATGASKLAPWVASIVAGQTQEANRARTANQAYAGDIRSAINDYLGQIQSSGQAVQSALSQGSPTSPLLGQMSAYASEGLQSPVSGDRQNLIDTAITQRKEDARRALQADYESRRDNFGRSLSESPQLQQEFNDRLLELDANIRADAYNEEVQAQEALRAGRVQEAQRTITLEQAAREQQAREAEAISAATANPQMLGALSQLADLFKVSAEEPANYGELLTMLTQPKYTGSGQNLFSVGQLPQGFRRPQAAGLEASWGNLPY